MSRVPSRWRWLFNARRVVTGCQLTASLAATNRAVRVWCPRRARARRKTPRLTPRGPDTVLSMSRDLSAVLLRIAGPTPLIRRLSTQSVLSAFGDGVFLTGSAVFFTQIVGLSASQVGLGLTVTGVVTFALAVPLGKLSDRFGAKRVWAASSLVEALLYLGWLAAGGWASFVAVMIAVQVVSTASRSARNAYRFDIF